ncbi:uncharacterized protein si:dkey-247k7.2 [Trichomycterus rosablanca]|uniref:uncharacterized protein si:dkey-247k7.2 n=1 Tax=Trichomycterus rosablanca TaxID=2290929 RepID=UPI002F35B1E4
MMRFWVAALALACFAVVVSSNATPAPQEGGLCQKYSDGTYLNLGRVFDMLMIEFRGRIQDMGTEKLKDFMKYADDDRDNRLSLDECAKLLVYAEKPEAQKQRR